MYLNVKSLKPKDYEISTWDSPQIHQVKMILQDFTAKIEDTELQLMQKTKVEKVKRQHLLKAQQQSKAKAKTKA